MDLYDICTGQKKFGSDRDGMAPGRGPAQGQIYYPDRPQNRENSRWGHGPPERNQKNPEFLQPPMAGPRGRGRRGCTGLNRLHSDTAESCDNLARLACAPGFKWEQVGTQMKHSAPCSLAGCAWPLPGHRLQYPGSKITPLSSGGVVSAVVRTNSALRRTGPKRTRRRQRQSQIRPPHPPAWCT